MHGLILALQFLTRLPTPRLAVVSPAHMAGCVVWFPLVGLLIGALVAASAWLGAQEDPWLGALLGLVAWVGLTGALHLDGLADLADALGAAHRLADPTARRERLLQVLADPHLGVFGGVALVLQLLAKLVLIMLAVQVGAYLALLLAPAWSRWGVLLWSRLPPLKPGLGERFAWRSGNLAIVFWALALALAGFLQPMLALGFVWTPAWRYWLLRRLGGMTGDALGAGVEWGESVLLLAWLLIWPGPSGLF
ncbi:MAG: adenosylcobinamide-GDP ribazoletransferase [Pseudomonadota bacterium]